MENHASILVCDDDQGIMDVTKIILSEKGYFVETLLHSNKIFSAIERIKPQLILLDLCMPDLSGDQIIRILKKNKTTKHIHVILVSASEETEEVAKSTGADDFLYKPFDASELEDKVAKYLQS